MVMYYPKIRIVTPNSDMIGLQTEEVSVANVFHHVDTVHQV